MIYKPRNDFVLVRIVQLDKVHGIVMPDRAKEGKRFIVEAIGPAVKELKVGDRVLMSGLIDATFFEVPGHKDLIFLKQEFVITTMEETQIESVERN